MPRFRARSSSVFSSTWEVRQAIADALRPAHFFEGRTIRLEWAEVEREEIAWEIFQGRLLDLAHTRCRQSFETWNIFRIGPEGRSSEPLLSVKLDAGNGLVHVTRAIFCYAQEGYHAGDNVYLSRETQKWVRELAGTIPLARMEDGETFRDELTGRLFQAVVGSSRLPLTSVEAPLPGFTLGELGYFYRSEVPAPREPMRSFHDLIEGGWEADLSWLEQVKLLELVLRATPAEHLEEATALWVKERRLAAETISQLLRGLFDEVALSPYTDFVARTMSFLTMLERAGGWSVEAHTDFLSHLLRQLGRHLTAYDLVTFHHRGANYPDILLLDTALKEYLALIERRPALFDRAKMSASCRRPSHACPMNKSPIPASGPNGSLRLTRFRLLFLAWSARCSDKAFGTWNIPRNSRNWAWRLFWIVRWVSSSSQANPTKPCCCPTKPLAGEWPGGVWANSPTLRNERSGNNDLAACRCKAFPWSCPSSGPVPAAWP